MLWTSQCDQLGHHTIKETNTYLGHPTLCFIKQYITFIMFTLPAHLDRCAPTWPTHPCPLPVSFSVVRPAGVDRSPVQDGGIWDWFTPAGQPDSGDTAIEVTYPKRLVQKIESEGEMARDYLDTRVKNSTENTLVSSN